MTTRLGYLAPILLIALPLAACEKDNPFEKALTTLNGGTPVPGGPSQSALYVSPSGDSGVLVVEVERCTVVPAHLFRTHQCDDVTGELIPIR
jgi:hypothetical protein